MLRALRSARAWGRSVRHWLLTLLGGTLCFLPLSIGSSEAGPIFLLIGLIALLASAPVVLLCVPLFGWVARVATLPQRWWLAASGIVLLVWAAVQATEMAMKVGSDSRRLILLFALPYLLAALATAPLVYPDLLRRPGPVPAAAVQPPRPLDLRRLLLFWLLQQLLSWVLLPLLRGQLPLDEDTRRYLLSGYHLLEALGPGLLALPFVGYLLAWAGAHPRRQQRLLLAAGGFAGLALLQVLRLVLPLADLGRPDAHWIAQFWLTGTAVPLVAALAVFGPALLRPAEQPLAEEPG